VTYTGAAIEDYVCQNGLNVLHSDATQRGAIWLSATCSTWCPDFSALKGLMEAEQPSSLGLARISNLLSSRHYCTAGVTVFTDHWRRGGTVGHADTPRRARRSAMASPESLQASGFEAHLILRRRHQAGLTQLDFVDTPLTYEMWQPTRCRCHQLTC
jgi:hypothetical protein